jgi:predicted transposase/invertase (TIGR01784 family)
MSFSMDDIEGKDKPGNEESDKDSQRYVPRFFNPCNDIAFKKVFVNHPESTKSFLNSTLKLEGSRRIETIEFLPTERLPKISESKKSILDVLCTDQDKHQFIIEVQNKSLQHYIQRAQYYVSHLYSSQLAVAGNYMTLKPVTLLSLMNHRIFPDEIGYISFHNNIERDTQVSYLNDMSYVFIEMPKFHKKEKDLKTVADYWIFMMKEAMYASEIPKNAPEEVR